MLVAALRSDNPLGGAPLTCDEAAETFTVQGLGEITAAKLLDLENRRQLVWADPVTREWVLETIALRARRAAAAQAAARVAAAAAAAQAVSAHEPAPAGGVVQAGAGTVVFEPPRTTVRPPAGIRAAQTRFEAPVGAAGGSRRVVWREPPSGAAPPEAEPSGATALPTPAPPQRAASRPPLPAGSP